MLATYGEFGGGLTCLPQRAGVSDARSIGAEGLKGNAIRETSESCNLEVAILSGGAIFPSSPRAGDTYHTKERR